MKGRRRWIRNTTKIMDDFAAGISYAAIDLILAHMAYREIVVPDWVNKARTRVLFVPDFTAWWTQPVDWNKLAIGVQKEDGNLFQSLVLFMIDEGMIKTHKKRGM